jgi:hypothetical protein
MAFETLDRKKMVFAGAMVVMLGLGAVVWYPRLFPAKRPIRSYAPPPLVQIEPTPRPAPAEAPPAPPAPASARAVREAPSAATVGAVKAVTVQTPKSVARAAAVMTPKAPNRPGAVEPSQRGRYGLEFPPFVTAAEAADLERRLKEAGLPTSQTTTDGSTLYTLVVGPFPDPAKAREAQAALGGKPSASADGAAVFGDGPYVLREVVRRALEVREKGYEVKIVREGEAPLYVLRTAARLDAAQATRLSRHYRELGFPNSVVSASR